MAVAKKSTKKSHMVVNSDTGEVLETAIVYRQRQKPSRIRFPDGFLIISKTLHNYCAGLTGSEMRLLTYLLSKLENMNVIYGGPTDWHKDLGTTVPSTSRSLKALRENGIVARKNRFALVVNPKCAWRGTATSHEIALKQPWPPIEHKHDDKKMLNLTNIATLPARSMNATINS